MKNVVKNYKKLVFAPLFGLSLHSCQPVQFQGHTNVVVCANNVGVLIKDVKTDKERLIDLLPYNQKDGGMCIPVKDMHSVNSNFIADALYLQPGDTINVSSAYNYDETFLLNLEHSTIKYDKQALKVRRDMEKINTFKQQFMGNQR